MRALVVDASGQPLVSSAALAFRPPALSSPTDLFVSSNLHPTLDPNTDYRIHLPADRALSGALILEGGRNITLIGGEITPTAAGQRGVYVKGSTSQTQPRVVHLEGLKVNGCLSADGFDLDAQGERGLTVQIGNCRAGDPANPMQGSYAGWHADVLQTWNGPARLLIDGLTGYTGYQGLMLNPRQFGGWTVGELGPWEFRRVNLVGVPGFTDQPTYSAYCAEQVSWATCEDVYGSGGAYQNRLPGLRVGAVDDFVTTAGRAYVSAGYLSAV